MKDSWKYFDKFTFLVLLIITVFGIIMIYSASFTTDKTYFTKQIAWFVFSLICFFLIFRIKTETIFRWRWTLFVGLLVCLIILLLAGIITSGVRSWFRIGFMSIQFSEFIKIPLALIIAKIMAKNRWITLKPFLRIVAVISIPFGLIMLQPDLGTAFILGAYFLILVLLKRIKFIILFTTIILLIGGSFLAWNYVLKPYQKNRLISFFNPEKYSKSTGYQSIQSKIAIGSGGLIGEGYLKGSQSQYKFLPTRHTDFVVSVLGEELGFMGVSLLFFLFFILFYRQFNIKTQTDEEFYFVYLFNGLILFQFAINVLMSIGFMPILGIPLPFISYGGSSLLGFFMGEAIIFKIKINTYINEF
jgi:rod shape determining protein RodA